MCCGHYVTLGDETESDGARKALGNAPDVGDDFYRVFDLGLQFGVPWNFRSTSGIKLRKFDEREIRYVRYCLCSHVLISAVL